MNKTLSIITLVGSLWASALMAGDQGFHYDEKSVESATYYAAITNLANAVMFSGLGEKLIISPYERDDWLRRAGFVTRPPMPDMGIVGPVYASSEPTFEKAPDFSKPETLRWKPGNFNRTLDPGAQAWTLLKITSPQFHLQFHDLPENRIAALMMVPQARVQASVLDDRLRNDDGVFAPRLPDGKFLEPAPRDQAAVLWAASSLILAGSSSRDDYWHMAYGDLTKADNYRLLADHAFAAINTLPPQDAADRAIAIEALGLYALAVRDDSKRSRAIKFARKQAVALMGTTETSLEDIALSIYGLVEASRLLNDTSYAVSAAERYRSALKPLWNESAGVFLPMSGKGVYTPVTAGAVVAALNAMRWYGPDELAGDAGLLYPRFFENALIRSGMLRASPLALVSKKYRDAQPAANFAHPLLPDSKDTGIAPVFAAEVIFDGGTWSVTNTIFNTSSAMFLSNMLALKSDGRADPFLPDDLLATIR